MAESVNDGRIHPMMCAVCGQVLDQFVDGETGERSWIHGRDFSTTPDHIVVPMDYNEDLLVTRCDFCYAEVPLAERWTVPCKDFRLDFLNQGSNGAWCACPTCARLVAGEAWPGLIERHLAQSKRRGMAYNNEESTIRAFLEVLYLELKTHQTGPVRRYQPGDELTTDNKRQP